MVQDLAVRRPVHEVDRALVIHEIGVLVVLAEHAVGAHRVPDAHARDQDLRIDEPRRRPTVGRLPAAAATAAEPAAENDQRAHDPPRPHRQLLSSSSAWSAWCTKSIRTSLAVRLSRSPPIASSGFGKTADRDPVDERVEELPAALARRRYRAARASSPSARATFIAAATFSR